MIYTGPYLDESNQETCMVYFIGCMEALNKKGNSMINEEEIAVVIDILESILKVVASIDHEAENNCVFIAINKAIGVLHKIGL